MPWRGPSAISTTRKWRRSARRRRGERADDAQSRRHRGAGGRRRAWRLRRRGARRSEAGACAADEGRARARRAAAAGQAYEPVPYTAEGQIDPFRPERIDVAAAGSRASVSKLAPDPNRPKEPLESFPLESIQMLGTITRNKEVFALVKAGPNLYRVQKGNYMGQNFGVVTAIDEGAINLKERVQDSGGEWVERTSALQLVEAKR